MKRETKPNVLHVQADCKSGLVPASMARGVATVSLAMLKSIKPSRRLRRPAGRPASRGLTKPAWSMPAAQRAIRAARALAVMPERRSGEQAQPQSGLPPVGDAS